ncbi:hypothetical protein ANCDUO_00567 [Ancylostoma duodenale]|uniref:Uncharacterized protein n=1 Tax=Ancylostoma duodenale TaxID=51022 RepID=A0A0C2DGI9_9BILA|nr:hypothetical protein ANCDUO_00567 [Ancylostoma duodenale]
MKVVIWLLTLTWSFKHLHECGPSILGLVFCIMERDNDPDVACCQFVRREFLKWQDLEADKRPRSILISGLVETEVNVGYQDRRAHLENKALAKLSIL